MKLCIAKSIAVFGRFFARLRVRVDVGVLACTVIVANVLCVPAPSVAAAQKPVSLAPLPVELQTALDRMALTQPGSPAFHMEAEFESTSDTGAVSRGSLSEDWWSESWWRHVTVVNGLKREVVQVAGKTYRDEDEGFLVPLRLELLLLATRRPLPSRLQQAGTDDTVKTGDTSLHCFTLPTAAEAPDLKAAPKSYCMDAPGNLRITADVNYRIAYNSVTPFGAHTVARSMLMLRKGQLVASLHVTRLEMLHGGPSALQDMSMDEQIRFALSNPRRVLLLPPLWMQRQLISTDVRMLPQTGVPLRAGQRFALVRVREGRGKLLDAEVLGASDDAARLLVMQVLRTASFLVPAQRAYPLLYEGTLMFVTP